MQLIHAIVAFVAASQATAIASNANLTPRSNIAEAANMKYTRDVEECKANCDSRLARRADASNAKSDCHEKCASDNQGEASKAKRGDDDDEKENEEEKEAQCFDQCSPYPGQNMCHESASCIYVTSGNPKFYCGCASGFKPEDVSPENAFRLPWLGQEGRVFVKPGVSCQKVCDNILTCAEVDVQPKCF
ncbi:hypothetical protein Cpir12675_006697 [Ceratocystis pirilliformis]|uniref:EGF-like domain-containing protein n=1 Tax=Ceratocystis pirilliformis TaxID=259994 RepID=A0ABR3YGX7_9PEZI